MAPTAWVLLIEWKEDTVSTLKGHHLLNSHDCREASCWGTRAPTETWSTTFPLGGRRRHKGASPHACPASTHLVPSLSTATALSSSQECGPANALMGLEPCLLFNCRIRWNGADFINRWDFFFFLWNDKEGFLLHQQFWNEPWKENTAHNLFKWFAP